MKFLIVPISGEKRTTVDHYSTGCESAEYGFEPFHRDDLPQGKNTLAEVFSELVGARISGSAISLQDPNWYQDCPDGTTRVTKDNASSGIYRASFNRLETKNGRGPSAETMAKFERDEIPLYLADYEVRFSVAVVFEGDASGDDLAKLLGVQDSEWSRPASDFITEAPTA